MCNLISYINSNPTTPIKSPYSVASAKLRLDKIKESIQRKLIDKEVNNKDSKIENESAYIRYESLIEP